MSKIIDDAVAKKETFEALPKQMQKYEIGTIALPAYIVFYRNPRTTNRWYIHRGYTMEAEAVEIASAFKRVGLDCIIYPMATNIDTLEATKILNAF